jgi:hypothetical protein
VPQLVVLAWKMQSRHHLAKVGVIACSPGAAAFQWINPKAWLIAAAAAGESPAAFTRATARLRHRDGRAACRFAGPGVD